MTRTLRALLAGAILCALMVGVPLLLMTAGTMPDLTDPISLLTRPDDGTVLVGLLTLLGWIAWLILAVSLVAEITSLVRGRSVRLPGLGAPQRLVGGLLLMITALGGATAHAAAADVTTAVVTDSTTDERVESPSAATSITPGRTHVVVAGDDLWTLAERYFGDGSQWRRIAAANPAQLTGGADHLEIGWRLTIPDVAVPPADSVTVAPGDSLWRLAAAHLGDGERWRELWQLNRAVVTDPDVLEVGTVLQLPPSTPDTLENTPPVANPSPQKPVEQQRAGRPAPGDQPRVEPPTTVLPASADVDAVPVDPVLAAVGALVAAGITGEVGRRRLQQLQERPIGRRIVPCSAPTERLRAALHRGQGTTIVELLTAAIESLTPADRQHVRWMVAFPERITAHLTGDQQLPAPWIREADHWALTGPVPVPETSTHWPTLVSLGRTATGGELLVDLARLGDLGLDLDDPAAEIDLLTGLLVQLAAADRYVEVHVDDAGELVEAFDSPLLHGRPLDETLDDLERRQRSRQADPGVLHPLHPDRDDAVQVVLVASPLSVDQRHRLTRLQEDPLARVCVVRAPAPGRVTLTGTTQECRLSDIPCSFAPHHVPATARIAVAELLVAASTTDTEPAPWQAALTGTPAPTSDTVHQLHPVLPARLEESHAMNSEPPLWPTIMLLGPIDLLGAAGPEPSRARRSLIEYATWLLEHPGRTGRELSDALFVTEGTRRSNLSRLRSWLGRADDGEWYLPEAWSGRMTLDELVSSDWHQFQDLVIAGTDAARTESLIEALHLVRGAPLADAAPNQWGWAEELRLDMTSMVRDVGVTLARRANADGDSDLARWAAARALTAAPDDELLLVERLRTEHECGNTADVQRLARRITHRSRQLGIDLLDDTVDVLQEVLEGAHRARRVAR